MGEQVAPVQEVVDMPLEFVLRHIVYSKLKKRGFEARGPGLAVPLKSGKSFGGGMAKGDLEVICMLRDGIPSVSVLLPVDERVRVDMLFKRVNVGERSVLVCDRILPNDDSDFDSAENIEQMVEECWGEVEKIIQHGAAILWYNEKYVYQDFMPEKNESAGGDKNISLVKIAIVGSILGVMLDQRVALDILDFLNKNGLDAPDSVRDYMLFFSKYPVLQRAFSAAFVACLTVPFLVALKDGLLKIVKKDKRQDVGM
ncbi:MAG: hypothetical protein Q8P62_00565 [Candidatus Peregrinibacteria bacterium]|nr:hypothetical protein [Candidatus Peregrinibacteria bacterium]